jgi:predicted DNA-binding transcriptional regulator AlpA
LVDTVLAHVGCSRASLFAWIKDSKFPAPSKHPLLPKLNAWDARIVRAWLDEQLKRMQAASAEKRSQASARAKLLAKLSVDKRRADNPRARKTASRAGAEG